LALVTDLHPVLFAGRGGTIVASGTEGSNPLRSASESGSELLTFVAIDGQAFRGGKALLAPELG